MRLNIDHMDLDMICWEKLQGNCQITERGIRMPDRAKVIEGLEKCRRYECDDCTEKGASHALWDCPAYDDFVDSALDLLKAQEPITGETSDGCHTFNELYHHRAVLFSVIVANYPDRAWKSKKHYDGTMYNGMFIVGINTPDGQATYHYNIDPYWDMFDCEVLEFAPAWDGHTPTQAIERIGKLALLKMQKTSLEQLAYDYGLTTEGVKFALEQYQTVICEITHGMISKLSYYAKDIIRTAQERWCDTCDLKQPIKPIIGKKEVDFRSEIVDIYRCGNCGYELEAYSGWQYCPMCGKVVKWE